jgi:hypothetical protein
MLPKVLSMNCWAKNKGLARKLLIAFATVVAIFVSHEKSEAQELNCTVEINTDQIEGTNKSVFQTLQEAMSEYFNSRKWTNAQFSNVEKIECRFFLIIKEYTDNTMKGELQVQVSRPVYNSTYTTSLLNFKDSKIEFTYQEGDQLIYNETTMESNLTAILNFYAYLFLALDFDSFSHLGGQPYFDKAATIVQMAQSSGEVGWKAFDDTKNRSAVLSSYIDNATSGIRELSYLYHRKGLDEMVTSPDKGRAAITESLQYLDKVYKTQPMSVALSMFRDSKLDELVNVYSKAPQTEREDVFKLLSPIYPTDTERLNKIKNPDNN